MLLEDKGAIVAGGGSGIASRSRTGSPLPDRSTRSTAQPSARLDLPSRIEMLDVADVLLGEMASTVGLDDDSRHAIQVAAHEAVTNAIVHGNHMDEARRVTLEVAVHPTGLEIRVQDEGQGFDPSCIPDPRAPENLWKSSGRGIFLMRALMDKVTFRRLSRGGMQVTMLKLFEPKLKVRQEG